MRLERIRSIRDGPGPPELGKLRHLQSLVSARIDAQEGFEVEFHVHGQAVVAGMATNADTDAAEFDQYREWALARGFLECVSGPLVRSSYRAEQALNRNNAGLNNQALAGTAVAK